MVDCTTSTLTVVDSAPAQLTIAKNQPTSTVITVLTEAQLLAFFTHSVAGCVHTANTISLPSTYFEIVSNNLMLKSTVSEQSAPEVVSVTVTAKIAVH